MTDLWVSSIIGLSGVIIGSIITSIYSLKIKSRETKLRIVEKIFDKRIQAHENILILIKLIRSVISTGKADIDGNLITYPSSMTSRENFDKFSNEIFLTFNLNAHWLNTELEREFWFLQDYLTSLSNIIQNAEDLEFPRIGIIVKQDFIDLASNLENLTFEFFRKDIYEMKINQHNEWHKYPKKETHSKFNKTTLVMNRSDIDKTIKNNNVA